VLNKLLHGRSGRIDKTMDGMELERAKMEKKRRIRMSRGAISSSKLGVEVPSIWERRRELLLWC
jgi:hypothetical protein